MTGLWVAAELNPDVVVGCSAPSIAFGQAEQLVDRASITLGSSGAITASAAARLGVPVGMVAVVGGDEAGALSTRMLAGFGVDVSTVVARPGRATGMTIVLSAPGGDRALLTATGTMADLTVNDVRAVVGGVVGHLHVSSVHLQTGLHDGLAQLFAELRSAGWAVSLDPGWDPREQWTAVPPLLAYLDHFLPNTQEAVAIARRCGHEVDTAVAAAVALASHGPVVLVKDGAHGAVLAVGSQVWRVAAPVVPVVDTTGAGDNADAGYLAALLAGRDPQFAARLAVACGSIAVQGWGGTGRLATLDDAESLAADLEIITTSYALSTKE